jgi:hypothetical protein
MIRIKQGVVSRNGKCLKYRITTTKTTNISKNKEISYYVGNEEMWT